MAEERRVAARLCRCCVRALPAPTGILALFVCLGFALPALAIVLDMDPMS